MTTIPAFMRQPDYVTKSEFEDFKNETLDRFDKVDERFDKVDARFDRIDKRFDEADTFVRDGFDKMDELITTLGHRIDSSQKEIIAEFNHVAAVQHENTAHLLKVALELVPGVDKKKADLIFKKKR